MMIVLASASPRRRQLLEQVGIRYRAIPVDVDETRLAAEAPEDYVRRLALAKAHAGARSADRPAGVPVLGADTAVVIGDDILGKPGNEAEAVAILARLSGRTHRVLTAVALVGHDEAVRVSESRVTFRDIDEAESRAYWRTGEPADKAGGYAIQGRGALFVVRIEGSYSGIVGLPLYETAELLSTIGFDLRNKW